MGDARRRVKLANLNHLGEEIAAQDRLLEEVARKSADWQGASDEVMATLRGLFDELRKALPRKQIALRDGNNIDGLRSQLSSASRKVKDAIEALSRDEAIKPAPNVSSEAIHVVFISSTFEDLREERAAVQKAVLQLGCLPIGMELFPSADDDAWGYIKGEIERCDYYVLIVGNRYGSVDPDGVSFTEREYRLARQLNKPCVVFVRSRAALIAGDKIEDDNAKKIKLDQLIAELNKSRLAQRFDNQDQLGGQAYISLDKLRKTRPTPGYIRASAHTSNSDLVALRTQYDALLAEHQSSLETSVDRPPVTPLSPEYLKLENDHNELKKSLFESQQSLRRCTDERDSLQSQLETPKIDPKPVSGADGFAFDPNLDRFRLNSSEGIALELAKSTSGMLGFTIAPVNTTAKMIESYQVGVTEANSWSAKHKQFLPCTGFNRKPAVRGGKLVPQTKHNGQWLIRVVGKEGEQSLTVYNDDSTPLRWPNDDPTDVQIWRLTIATASSDAPDFRGGKVAAMPPSYVVVRWDKKFSTLLMAPYDKPVEQEDGLSPTPLNPLNSAEDAVVDWLRRIHFQGRVRFRKPYPGIIAVTAQGDTIGYLIGSTAAGMERLIQETAFNNFDDLRRLYIVMISQDNRELTAAARSMLTRKLPARVFVTIGMVENGFFVPKEEHPQQAESRTA